MATALRLLQQGMFIPQPSLTEENISDQTGKVHIVTGGYSGVGYELVKILYSKHATIYSAGRSRDKALKSIEAIKAAYPSSNGKLYFLLLDLSDLSTIKKSAEDFMGKETRLDVLTNNAGIMVPPKGSRDAQGHELQIGTNCLGPFLFTSFLIPLLKKTAASSPPGTVRITWAASSAIELSPKGGVEFELDGTAKIHDDPQKDYCQSKAGNVLLAFETARRYGGDGIVSVARHPSRDSDSKWQLHPRTDDRRIR
ncbi:hypothetical protein V502_08374 [Pseudogymnoascus sp. VKM F-4520 (FW-2644)]|nr:hypothetical protein V502_08374 [Pseudogymnoascus sp. VKM F-4520 (FW-2644)]